MIRHRLMNSLRLKLTLVLLLGAVAVAAPALAPNPAAAAKSQCPYQGGHPLLTQGVINNEDVAHAQCLLKKIHSYAIAIDGDFGPITYNTVRNFQASEHLKDVDGKIGDCTWEALHPDGEPAPSCYVDLVIPVSA